MCNIDNHVLEKQLQQQLQDYYHYDEKPQVLIMCKNFDKIMINIYFNNAPNIETVEHKTIIQNIISNRLKRIFNLLYYSNDIVNYDFSYHYSEHDAYLILTIKENTEHIKKIVEKLFDTIIIVLPNNVTISDKDIELYHSKRSILDTVSEYGLIEIAHDNSIDDGEYYDSKLADYAIDNYNDDVHNVFIMNTKMLTIEDFKTFCLLLDKEYDIIVSGSA